MLNERGVEYAYRDYRKQPLSESEVRRVLLLLGARPAELLRRNDRAFKELELTGEESDDRLIRLMAEHPTLLQRPIGILGDRAAVGRPPERLLALMNEIR